MVFALNRIEMDQRIGGYLLQDIQGLDVTGFIGPFENKGRFDNRIQPIAGFISRSRPGSAGWQAMSFVEE
jgi:hypothetical protein